MTTPTETLGVDGVNPLSEVTTAQNRPRGYEASFRTGLVSLLAAGIGMLAGVIAWLLYNLIGLSQTPSRSTIRRTPS